MTDAQLVTPRNTRSRPLVTSAVLAGAGAVLGLTGLALAALAALSVLREGMDRMGMPSSELHRRFHTRKR